MDRSLSNKRLLAAAVAAAAVGTWWALAQDDRPVAHVIATGPPAVAAMPSAAPGEMRAATPALAFATHVAPAPKFRLLQVGAAERSGRDVAVMRIDGGVPTSHAVGDAVARGVRLVRILPSSIEVDDHGRLQRIPLEPEVGLAMADLRPLRALQHGADAASASAAAPEPELIARAADAPPAHSSAIDRAIQRAQQR